MKNRVRPFCSDSKIERFIKYLVAETDLVMFCCIVYGLVMWDPGQCFTLVSFPSSRNHNHNSCIPNADMGCACLYIGHIFVLSNCLIQKIKIDEVFWTSRILFVCLEVTSGPGARNPSIPDAYSSHVLVCHCGFWQRSVNCHLVRRGMSTTGMSAPASGASNTEHITVPVEKDQQHGVEAAFHLNPTEPHSYQVSRSLLLR